MVRLHEKDRTNAKQLQGSLRRRTAMAIKRAVLCALTLAAIAFQGSATAASRYTMDQASYLNGFQELAWARWAAGIARAYNSACGISNFLTGIPFDPIGLDSVFNLGAKVYGIDNVCDAAQKWGLLAYNMYHGHYRFNDNHAYFRLTVMHEDRSLFYDRCIVWVNYRGNWIIGSPNFKPAFTYLPRCLGE